MSFYQKYIGTFCLLICCNSNLYSQDQSISIDTINDKKWLIEITATYLASFTTESIISVTKLYETPKFSYSLGLLVGYRINKTIAIKSGITFTRITQIIGPRLNIYYNETGARQPEPDVIINTYNSNLNTSYGVYALSSEITNAKQGDGNDYIEGDPLTLGLHGKQIIDFFSIPIIADYIFLESDLFSISGIVGINPTYFVSTNLDTESKRGLGVYVSDKRRNYNSNTGWDPLRIFTSDFQIEFNNGDRNINISYELGLGINMNLSNSLYLKTQITYSKSILPVFEIEDYAIFQKSFNFQLVFGFFL